jgi:two-component system response regulator FixJ
MRYVSATAQDSLELNSLTDRERQVVAGIVSGKTGKEVAFDLGIAHATVRVLLARGYARLGVRSQRQLRELPGLRGLAGVPVPAAPGAQRS